MELGPEIMAVLQGGYNLSPVAMLLILLFKYQRGDFVSKREHQETRDDRDLARADAKELRVALHEALVQNAKLMNAGQVGVEVARATTAVIRRQRGDNPEAGGDHE